MLGCESKRGDGPMTYQVQSHNPVMHTTRFVNCKYHRAALREVAAAKAAGHWVPRPEIRKVSKPIAKEPK